MPDAGDDVFHSQRLQLASPNLKIRVTMTFDDKRTQEAFDTATGSGQPGGAGADHAHTCLCLHAVEQPHPPNLVENEMAALALMAQTARTQLERYPTSYEADRSASLATS